jgi:hypothetical protein
VIRLAPMSQGPPVHTIGWSQAFRQCWRWRPRRAFVVAGVVAALLFNLLGAWLICSTLIPWPRSRVSPLWNAKRVGDSHLVWFTGRRGRLRESFHIIVDGPSQEERRTGWFDEALRQYESESDDALRADPPDWGPLATLWRGGDPYAGLDKGLSRMPLSRLPSCTRAQFGAGWPLISLGYWLSDTSLTAPDRYHYFYGWRPAWYARRAPNRLWALPLRPIWPGFLANGLLYFCAAVLPCMLAATVRRAARLRRGRCPACRYDLSGLPPGSPCPECAAEPRRADT